MSKNFLLTILRLICGGVVLLAIWRSEAKSEALPGAATPTINLRFADRPPYMIVDKTGIHGETASPAQEAFVNAKIPFQLLETPLNRQMIIISENKGYDCGIGWFKTPAREKFAQFTEAISQDGPWIILGNKKMARIPIKNLKSLFANKNLRLIIQTNFSYGPYLDGLLRKERPTLFPSSASALQMVQMIHSERMDYMFSSNREIDYLLTKLNFTDKDFFIHAPPESPRGEKRYIMCSRQVPPSVIQKLNEALKK